MSRKIRETLATRTRTYNAMVTLAGHLEPEQVKKLAARLDKCNAILKAVGVIPAK